MPSVYDYALAGLLHDVGKLGLRAFEFRDGLSEKSENLATMACPTGPHGRHTHIHVLYTAEFTDNLLDFTPEGIDREAVFRMAVYHHRPDSPDAQVIAEADRLSSSERAAARPEDVMPPQQFRQRCLRPIVNEVRIGDAGPESREWCVPPEPLDPRDPFPQPLPEEELMPKWRQLWQGLWEEWKANEVADPWGYIARALSILERYTHCVPAASNVYPDISLFDHLKTTAAIAVCLSQAGDRDKPFVLAAAEAGGIQSYVYDIRFGGGGMARKLRARSLYVWLVMENVVHYVLRSLGLPLTNVILSAGGRSTLLLPNTEQTLAVLEEAQARLADWMRAEVSCRLYPCFAWTEAGREDLQDFPELLRRLHKRLKAAKARPLSALCASSGGWREEAFLLPPVKEADEELCDSCQRVGGKPRREFPDDAGNPLPLCDRCYSDMAVGQRLVRQPYIAFFDSDFPAEERTAHRLPFGWFRLEDQPQPRTGPVRPYLVIDLAGGDGTAPEAPVVRRFVARWAPHKLETAETDGKVQLLDFKEIAEQSRGDAVLAYLKADVDNLGYVFYRGLAGGEGDETRVTISRIATLSRCLELFFGGYVGHLARTLCHVYTVYSGGDDLVLIGPWDVMLSFAVRLRRDFERFTCFNKAWSLSAAVVLAHHKTPVLTAVRWADERLEAAKRSSGNMPTPYPLHGDRDAAEATVRRTSRQWLGQQYGEAPSKNRLVALGTSIPWEQAAEALKEADRLIEWIEQGAVSKSQVRRLLRYAQMFQRWQETEDALNFRCFPLLAYDLRRTWAEASEEVRQWAKDLGAVGNQRMPLLRFICEYALRATRSREEKGGENQ